MPAEGLRPLDVERLVTTLARHEVRYLVVGGIAALLHGWPGTTVDFDALAARDPGDLERLAAALLELGAHGAGWDGTPANLASRTAWAWDTDAGPVDLMFVLEPWGTYDELWPDGEEVPAFGVAIPLISLDHLIELKRALGRPKDLRVVAELDELRRRRRS